MNTVSLLSHRAKRRDLLELVRRVAFLWIGVRVTSAGMLAARQKMSTARLGWDILSINSFRVMVETWMQ